jgi:hypothetical protein
MYCTLIKLFFLIPLPLLKTILMSFIIVSLYMNINYINYIHFHHFLLTHSSLIMVPLQKVSFLNSCLFLSIFHL